MISTNTANVTTSDVIEIDQTVLFSIEVGSVTLHSPELGLNDA